MTFEVLKLSKFKEINELHKAKVLCIFTTFEVSKLLKSKVVKDSQW